jgi:cephalosporin-C deacetylase-like acetyl esterase
VIIDKLLAELERYKPLLTSQHDFDAFWEQTQNESADQPLHAMLEEVPYPVERVTVYRVSYDGFGPATRIASPILLSVALRDTICPPSTGFAVYNHLTATEKKMCVYPYNGHEGDGAIHEEEKYRFVRQYFR